MFRVGKSYPSHPEEHRHHEETTTLTLLPLLALGLATLAGAAEITTNCGRGNKYSDTCLGNYDGGEDIIFEFHLEYAADVEIIMDPLGTGWTGLALDTVCPPGPDCLYSRGSSGVRVIQAYLEAGVYYIMVDTCDGENLSPNFFGGYAAGFEHYYELFMPAGNYETITYLNDSGQDKVVYLVIDSYYTDMCGPYTFTFVQDAGEPVATRVESLSAVKSLFR